MLIQLGMQNIKNKLYVSYIEIIEWATKSERDS